MKGNAMKKDPDTLGLVGLRLFGPAWKAILAEELGVTPRTMRRWLANEFQIPEGVWTDMIAICEKRQKEIGVCLKMLS